MLAVRRTAVLDPLSLWPGEREIYTTTECIHQVIKKFNEAKLHFDSL